MTPDTQFFVRDERTAHLNIALAGDTRVRHGGRIRPALLLSSRYPPTAAGQLAAEYVAAGITELELRISPLGGENESVRTAFGLLDAFTSAGLAVTLGQSGNIGQVALALGHAGHYSVGIGMREKIDPVAAITRQKTPPKQSDDGEKQSGGPTAGIYLPGLALTTKPPIGRAFLAHTDIRTRVGCRLGICGTSVHGPGLDQVSTRARITSTSAPTKYSNCSLAPSSGAIAAKSIGCGAPSSCET